MYIPSTGLHLKVHIHTHSCFGVVWQCETFMNIRSMELKRNVQRHAHSFDECKPRSATSLCNFRKRMCMFVSGNTDAEGYGMWRVKNTQ